jgi:hypothetical protein
VLDVGASGVGVCGGQQYVQRRDVPLTAPSI